MMQSPGAFSLLDNPPPRPPPLKSVLGPHPPLLLLLGLGPSTLTSHVSTSCLMQVNHDQSLEMPFPTDASTTSPSAPTTSGRRLTAASAQTSAKRMTLDRASGRNTTFNEPAILSELMMDSQAAVLTHVSHKRTTLDST